MEAALKYSMLDVRALRPYLWALLAPLAIVLPVAWIEPILLISALPLLLVIMTSSFVFSLDESAGLNLLHAMLPGTKTHAVYGRYALLFVALMGALAVAMIGTLAVVIAGRSAAEGYLAVATSALFSGLMFLSIQLPLFIRFGYTKARYWGYAAYLLVMGAYGAALWFNPSLAARMFTGAWPLLTVAAALAIFVSSARGAAKAVEKLEN